MHRRQREQGLELHHDQPADHQVGSPLANLHVLVSNWQHNLPFERDAAQRQREHGRCFRVDHARRLARSLVFSASSRFTSRSSLMTKDQIIAEIRRTAAENGGVAFGQGRFEKETMLSAGSWRGKYWRTWSEAVEEAGFAANLPAVPHPKDALVSSLLRLTRENKRFPTQADLRMAKRTDASFPWEGAFAKLGAFAGRVKLVRAYATEHAEYQDILALLPAAEAATVDGSGTPTGGDGSVYMLKLGKHYKIGKSFSVPRRHQEIAIELPEKPDVVHVITTDDPTGIEAYWHKRLDEKHTNGEWFALTREDVQAFKRRRFM